MTTNDVGVLIFFFCVAAGLFFFRKKTRNLQEEFDRMNHEYQVNGCFMDENGVLQKDVDGLIYRWEALKGKEATIVKVIEEPVLQQGNFDGSGY